MLKLPTRPLTSERFAPYGQVIWPRSDEADWQPGDAELELNQGEPRLYLIARTQLQVFSVPPRCIVKLHPGTWHAGHLFERPTELVFCNLELRDTNAKDRAVLPLMEVLEAVIRP